MQFIYKGELYDYIYDDIKGKLVFDIGSNIGQITRRLINADCRVVAVEPQAKLTFNKNYEGVYAIKHECVADKIGEVDFYKCEKDPTISSCLESWKTIGSIRTLRSKSGSLKREKITLPTITLDALIEDFGKPKYIKIDVEGYEDKVLEGLSHKVDLISFEFSRWFEDCTIRCLDILEERFGFKKLMPFVKKKFTVNGSKKQHAYCGEYYTKEDFIKDLDKFVELTAIDNRNVGDILVIL